jgi:hypothetical protein
MESATNPSIIVFRNPIFFWNRLMQINDTNFLALQGNLFIIKFWLNKPRDTIPTYGTGSAGVGEGLSDRMAFFYGTFLT